MLIFYSCSIFFYMVNYRRRTPAGRKSASCSSAVDPEPLSLVEKEAIEESLEDIKHGRVYTLEEVKKELGF
jgi:hypothetical protein